MDWRPKMPDFESVYPLAGVNRGLIPAASTPLTPTTPLSAVRLRELRNDWLKGLDLSPLSVEIYTSATKQFLNWLEKNETQNIGQEDILTYRRHLEESSKKPTTVKLYIVAIRQFFKWLGTQKVYTNVAQDVNVPKIEQSSLKDYLTSEQVKAVLDRISRLTEIDRRDYAMLLLMVTCGLRRIEICRANVEDLRTVEGSARLYVQGRGKTEKTDYVKIPPPVETAIREYISERDRRLPVPAIPLFTSVSNNSHGKRVSVRCVTGIVKERLSMAGYENDRQCTHCLRQTAVTLAILAGQPLQEVQQFARHTSIATTMIFVQNINKENNTCAQTIAGAIL
jgi:integrase/recombinase XerD